jgi:hypothetical protein
VAGGGAASLHADSSHKEGSWSAELRNERCAMLLCWLNTGQARPLSATAGSERCASFVLVLFGSWGMLLPVLWLACV